MWEEANKVIGKAVTEVEGVATDDEASKNEDKKIAAREVEMRQKAFNALGGIIEEMLRINENARHECLLAINGRGEDAPENKVLTPEESGSACTQALEKAALEMQKIQLRFPFAILAKPPS